MLRPVIRRHAGFHHGLRPGPFHAYNRTEPGRCPITRTRPGWRDEGVGGVSTGVVEMCGHSMHED